LTYTCNPSKTAFLRQGITHTSIFRLLSTVSNFLIALLLARFLGPKVKGDATIFITTTTFLAFFCSFVGGQALVYLVPRFRVENLIVPAYIWTLLVCGICYVLFLHYDVFTWRRSLNICIVAMLSSLVNINASVLLAKKEIQRYNLINVLPVIVTTIGLLCGILFLHADNIYGYLYPLYAGYLIAVAVSFAFAVRYVNIRMTATVFDDLDSALKYGVGFQIFDLLQLLNFRLYFFLFYHLQGAADLGLFSTGVSILEAVWILGRSVFVIHYSDFSSSDDKEIAIRQTLRYIKIVSGLSFVLLAGIALCPTSVYGFVFGQYFANIKHEVKWLFPGVLIYGITLVIQSVYLSKASYGRLILAQFVGLVVSVTLCYLWIPRYYYSGAAASASAAYITCTLIMLAFFIYDFKVPLMSFLPTREDIDFINNVLKSYLRKQKDN
jgi:O-antigen/teichoic acid export membrane protein